MSTQKSVVLIAPRFSQATVTSRKIGVAFKEYFEQNGVNVLALGHYRVRRIPFLVRLREQQLLESPNHLVIYIGHGQFMQKRNSLIGGEYLGSRSEILTLLNTGPYFINQRLTRLLTREPTIFFTIGCSTGELGKHLVNKGLTSFIGTFLPTWVSNVDLDEDNVPDIIPIYLSIIQSLMSGNPISAGIEAMKFMSKIYYNRAKLLPESEEKTDILNTFASPQNYKLIGKDIKWIN